MEPNPLSFVELLKNYGIDAAGVPAASGAVAPAVSRQRMCPINAGVTPTR